MLDLLFRDEKVCLLCKEIKEKKINYICKDCFNMLSFSSDYFDIKGYDAVYSVLDYTSLLRKHLFAFKYSNKSYYYKVFGEIMVYEIIDKDLLSNIDYIIPIPLHRSKKAFRGYNQSELLAKYISEKLEIPMLKDLLYKVKRTKDQHDLSGLERKKNLVDVFKIVDGDRIKAKNILVIDDVLTTGTTMIRAGEVLGRCGLDGLYGLTLATVK